MSRRVCPSTTPGRVAAFLIAAAITLANVSIATAQIAGDPELERIASLVALNRLGDARSSLQRWIDLHPSTDTSVTSNDRALAYFLRGSLATDWDGAEEAYVAIALGYPISPHAPHALLRLGQGLVTRARTGERNATRRAVAYLQRLIADYPTATLRPAALLWLARAFELDGRRSDACSRLQEARSLRADSTTITLIRAETARLCSAGTT